MTQLGTARVPAPPDEAQAKGLFSYFKALTQYLVSADPVGTLPKGPEVGTITNLPYSGGILVQFPPENSGAVIDHYKVWRAAAGTNGTPTLPLFSTATWIGVVDAARQMPNPVSSRYSFFDGGFFFSDRLAVDPANYRYWITSIDNHDNESAPVGGGAGGVGTVAVPQDARVIAPSDIAHTGGAGLERWYAAGQVNATALTTGAPTANVLRAFPLIVPRRTFTWDRIAFNVTTFAAGNARIGIYKNVDDHATIYPGSLYFDSGSISTGTNGVKTATPALGFNGVSTSYGHLAWLVIVGDAAPTVRCQSVGGMLPIGNDNTLPTTPSVGLSVAHAYAALPGTFPAGAAEITAAPIPSIYVRYSA